jgi:hypothetical protein
MLLSPATEPEAEPSLTRLECLPDRRVGLTPNRLPTRILAAPVTKLRRYGRLMGTEIALVSEPPELPPGGRRRRSGPAAAGSRPRSGTSAPDRPHQISKNPSVIAPIGAGTPRRSAVGSYDALRWDRVVRGSA